MLARVGEGEGEGRGGMMLTFVDLFSNCQYVSIECTYCRSYMYMYMYMYVCVGECIVCVCVLFVGQV